MGAIDRGQAERREAALLYGQLIILLLPLLRSQENEDIEKTRKLVGK